MRIGEGKTLDKGGMIITSALHCCEVSAMRANARAMLKR